ncbi:lipopolysaccharide biosynthesis protein [Roseovarius aestuarii]|uniref:Lipopolysaccharide biosynthesis protein WzxC n=1 Tax=Roseovarius aestuarii TaxID=475083 RepID=A0A1X7BT80_9RHOB|nr:lipopolysaccharide biosynthesis protein [Roseovarius aestuarii]SMC12861.1 Lipopolysaccharide biosynthesis protein WzxC [Roseovarius aestuarii]
MTGANAYHPHLVRGRSRAAVFGVLWSSLHTLIPSITSGAVFFVGAYFLSPADFGLVGLASSVVLFMIAFSPVAFGEALVQRQSVARAHADSVFWLTASVGVLFCLPFMIAASPIAERLGEPAIAALLPVLALRIPLELLATVPNAMIVRSMKFKLIALRTSIATLVSALISVSMLLAGYGYWALVISQVSGSFVSCAMSFWVSGWRPGLATRPSALWELAHYGLFASGDRMLATMRLDLIVLGSLGGNVLLGLYFFAQRFFQMLTQLVSGALSSVTHALLSTLQDDREKAAQAFSIASFVSAAVSMPMFCLAGLLIKDLLALLPEPGWEDAAFAIQAFCVAGILASVGVVQAALIKSRGKAHWWFYYQLVQQGSTIAVIALTYRYGLPTLMVVLVAKSFLIWPASLHMTARLLGISIRAYLAVFAGPAAATLAMGLAVVLTAPLLEMLSPVAGLGTSIALAFTIYVPTLALLSYARIRRIRHLLHQN